jgi:hypothetical protein
MGIGEINFIEIPGTDVTLDTMDITVDFTQDLGNPIITNKLLFGGYSALNFQPIKDYISAEEYKNVLKSIAKNYTVETEFKTLETENDGIENLGKKPFVLKVTFDGKDLIQKAGENYLFSIGQVIGKQTELYQETKRTLAVEMEYPHAYQRTIKVILPKLTKVKNLEKLIFDIKAQINSINQAAFISNYSEKDNVITITNSEYYNQNNFPLSSFEDYRKVINAAADFNKIVIILSK